MMLEKFTQRMEDLMRKLQKFEPKASETEQEKRKAWLDLAMLTSMIQGAVALDTIATEMQRISMYLSRKASS